MLKIAKTKDRSDQERLAHSNIMKDTLPRCMTEKDATMRSKNYPKRRKATKNNLISLEESNKAGDAD